jgi:decaprenylphospho-beta-D-ribofuranose 2-oxidase
MAVATGEAGVRQVISGFGRTAPARSVVIGPIDRDRVRDLIATRPALGLIARGAGLSYGDAAQNSGGVVLGPVTRPVVKLDASRQTVTASAGTTFGQILTQIVPAGFVLPVLPGTRHLTVGGAVAADVHGKNHERDGSLSAWIEQVDLVDGTGELRCLTAAGDPDGLQATVGGMGLTGVILSAQIRLQPIRSDMMEVTSHRMACLDEVLSLLETAKSQYSVAWIDATATGVSLGRGIVDIADHAGQPGSAAGGQDLAYRQGRARRAPAMPVSVVTPLSARAFNSLWFRKAPARHSRLADLATFFHRLDAVDGWNRAVGPAGLIQYQFVVPETAEHVLTEVLEAVGHNGCAPFLGTLKRFGPASGGPLSFPVPGWCLAIDMPAGRPQLARQLQALDLRVSEAGGRVYLAKDSRLRRDAFDAMYGPLTSWRATRARLDPHEVFQSDLGRRLGLC